MQILVGVIVIMTIRRTIEDAAETEKGIEMMGLAMTERDHRVAEQRMTRRLESVIVTETTTHMTEQGIRVPAVVVIVEQIRTKSKERITTATIHIGWCQIFV
jgi:hypothetical protein